MASTSRSAGSAVAPAGSAVAPTGSAVGPTGSAVGTGSSFDAVGLLLSLPPGCLAGHAGEDEENENEAAKEEKEEEPRRRGSKPNHWRTKKSANKKSYLIFRFA